MNILIESLQTVINSILSVVSSYGPKFVAGFLILFIGLIVASLLKDLIRIIFHYFQFEKWLETIGIAKEDEVHSWPNLIAELLRWTTIFVFLISAVEVWGIPKVGEVLNQLLLFLPNVFVVVIIGWIGLVAGRFAFDIVRHGVRGLGKKEAIVLGNAAKYTIIFFTILIILAQLGVAAELVKILFTGIVAMFALAFGLAFGFGGQGEARDILKNLRSKLNEKSEKKGSKK